VKFFEICRIFGDEVFRFDYCCLSRLRICWFVMFMVMM